ncbi:T9SS type A sorting domain-containing protein [Bacteroidales bacterium OttesenSCG-928-B11]|nr:T9SS type A sorting domain-containing protein [Bacteroidales bacterium OttesenSCG-928-E04]MDL2312338.1 T9SS type A sorting domain-containing protein [Bacteroidales bacterium OttesenSCG-928-B11]MDL2326285.1 T9SS type A sorting domain-containing protein [Bacteroidales bacterium OttesenSCG-928-A14]
MKKIILLAIFSTILIYGQAQIVSAIVRESNTGTVQTKLYTTPFRDDGLIIAIPETPTFLDLECSWITESDTLVLLTTYDYQVILLKNGELIDITGEERGVGTTLFVEGEDIYVLWNKIYSDHYSISIWKNGETHCEINNQDYIRAFDMYVSDSNIYVVGYSARYDISKDKPHAALWVNGAVQYLSGPYGSAANSIFVSDSNVYIVGWGSDFYWKQRAKIWINGVEENLTAGEYLASAHSVYVEGGDVYVLGTEVVGPVAKPRLWKNGVKYLLSSLEGGAYCIRVFEGDVYIGGELNDMAVIWKNGVPMNDFAKLCSIGAVYDLFIFPDTTSNNVNDLEKPLFNATLYPNPATRHVTIDLPSDIPSAQFFLFDMYGRLLLQEPIWNGEKINLSNLASGIYLYQVDSEKGRATGKVMIKGE